MTKVSAKAQHGKAGRPPGRVPRPRITLDNGDFLIPKDEAAGELGISRRTLTRMRVPTTRVGGVAYVSQRGLRQHSPMDSLLRKSGGAGDERSHQLRSRRGRRPDRCAGG